jgi:hypothetical protein
MADNAELEVIRVQARRNGTYYVLNCRSKSGLGVVTCKHTLSNTMVCNTCNVADTLGRPDSNVHKGCEHTRVVVRHLEAHGEPGENETWNYGTLDGDRVLVVT